EITTPRRPQGASPAPSRRPPGQVPGTARAPRREDVGPERVRRARASELEALQVAEARVGGGGRVEVRRVVLDDVLLDLVLLEDGREVDDAETEVGHVAGLLVVERDGV